MSIAVCVACLITVEFLPAGLLTPIADGLGISQGMAGQTLTATAFAAIFASLFVSTLTRGIDRPVGAAFLVLNRTGVPAAMLAIFAIFAGQFAFFTYLRPFFESVSQFDVTRISAVLLLFGIANDAESAGGLQVAVIQIANAFGAALGSYLLDASGPKAPFLASTLLLALAGLVVLGAVSVRMGRPKAVFGCAGSLGANEASS